ncbi:MAG: carboxymuconolactone decarboxylase family protein [Desulfobaccales bacterium]|nr:carboxymuconolactone decarboxylase family protein [Desulfobaccales bacterium]
MDFLALLKKAGFPSANFVKLTGFKSSPYTEGALFYAEKPGVTQEQEVSMSQKKALQAYEEFRGLTFGPGVLDLKTKYLIALGASLAAGCDP